MGEHDCETCIYRLLLYLHPPLFREQFAKEMLWIFDLIDAGISRLLVDAALSLLKQHIVTHIPSHRMGELFQQTPVDSIHVVRFVQAGAIALLFSTGFFYLLQESVPLPEPPRSIAVRRYRPDICGDLSVSARTSERRHTLRGALLETRSRP